MLVGGCVFFTFLRCKESGRAWTSFYTSVISIILVSSYSWGIICIFSALNFILFCCYIIYYIVCFIAFRFILLLLLLLLLPSSFQFIWIYSLLKRGPISNNLSIFIRYNWSLFILYPFQILFVRLQYICHYCYIPLTMKFNHNLKIWLLSILKILNTGKIFKFQYFTHKTSKVCPNTFQIPTSKRMIKHELKFTYLNKFTRL